jgi:myo-inositol-1(or 4)-monophosphatase
VTEHHDLRDLAIECASAASALIVGALGRVGMAVGTKSSPVDMVTEMDNASEALIVGMIRARRPHDGFIGEEGSNEPGTSGVQWLIDPIDGTTNYIYRQPGFAVSIAAQLNGETVAGVVDDPMLHEQYVATLGEGAFCNGAALAVSAQADLATALIGTGFSYDARRRARQAQVLRTVLPRIRDLRRRGSAALELCWVAGGRLDGYFEDGINQWDVAAGELIVREAGGRTGVLAAAAPGRSSVAAAPGIYDELRELLTATDAGG